jgi:hypothetical protein
MCLVAGQALLGIPKETVYVVDYEASAALYLHSFQGSAKLRSVNGATGRAHFFISVYNFPPALRAILQHTLDLHI